MPILPIGHKLHVRLPSGCRYFAVKIKCYGLFLFVQLILTTANTTSSWVVGKLKRKLLRSTMPSMETTGVMPKIVLDWIQLIIENDSTVEVFKVMLQCFLFTSSHKGVPQSKKSTKKKFRSSSIFKKKNIYIFRDFLQIWTVTEVMLMYEVRTNFHRRAKKVR